MRQAKFSLTDQELEFLDRHKELGYRDRSQLVRHALDRFRAETEDERLDRSAALYASLYEEDTELQELTEAAIQDWPE